MKYVSLILATLMMLSGCSQQSLQTAKEQSVISESVISRTIDQLKATHPQSHVGQIERGVRHAASLWWPIDGTEEEFIRFCQEHYVAEEALRDQLFTQVNKHFETLNGHLNWMTLKLQEPVHLKYGEVLPIDELFSGYNPGAHLQDDLYANKIAFVIALNFPYYALSEKQELGRNWSRKEWAQARIGDLFTARIPAKLQQDYSKVSANADLYISQYNIYAGNLRTNEGKPLFPKDMVLLSHWNLRDEIKANYPLGPEGFEKQQMIYRVMKHIINQSIPEVVINNENVTWNPFNNQVAQDGETISANPEPDTRYLQIINNFRALKAMDPYSPLDTYIRRHFEGSMEIAQSDVEALFIRFLESDVLKPVGKLISTRLGRNLQPFDIWYDGFKARSSINEELLTGKTRQLYPDATAFNNNMPQLLVKLGFTMERALEISDKITVDPARGSGHAWGAALRGMQSHLRTRIPDTGMDYKGYNIAMHEFGHNVEQTISLYNVDHYMLSGVPNTAFTEALAFIFQKRDLYLLDMNEKNDQAEALRTLDLLWSSYEIMGVSLLDMRVWKWLYQNPNANETQLKEKVMELAREIWNDYYAPVYGMNDEPILAIYSHMVSYPLYLSAYAYGNIIEFQLEEHLKNKPFATEIDRIYRLGRLTPNHWMQQAVGYHMAIEPMLNAAKEALSHLN